MRDYTTKSLEKVIQISFELNLSSIVTTTM